MKVSHALICLVLVSLFSIPASAELIIGSTSVIDTGDTEAPWSPAWSPDGNSIAYVAYDDSHNQQIFTIKIDGTGKKQVTNSINKKWGVTWLEDEISFLSYDTDGLEKIFLVHPDGSGVRKLLDEKSRQGRAPWDKPFGLAGASWNPKSKTILFTSYDSVTNDEKVFQVNMDGTGKKEVVIDDQRQWNPSWNPDGNSFVYVSYDSKNIQQLFTANADGTNKTQITFDDLKKYDPSWGQGGILFISTETAISAGDKLFIINPDGAGKKPLLDGGGFKQENPRWSRDGTKIIYEDITVQGNLTFKVLNLQQPVATITPAALTPAATSTPALTPTATATPAGTQTSIPGATETPKAMETPAKSALKQVVYSMLLVLAIIVVVMLVILAISNILSKKK